MQTKNCVVNRYDNSFSTTFPKSITFKSSTEDNMVDININRQNKAVILIHPINALIKSIRQETARQDTPKRF